MGIPFSHKKLRTQKRLAASPRSRARGTRREALPAPPRGANSAATPWRFEKKRRGEWKRRVDGSLKEKKNIFVPAEWEDNHGKTMAK